MRHFPTSISALLAALLIGAAATAPAAEADADIALQQAPYLRGSVQSIASSAGYAAGDVEVTSAVHQVTVTVINSKLNARGAAARESEALRIADALSASIAGIAPFSQVLVIHVDYVERAGARADAVQRLDFYKGPGGFLPHKT
jgi:Lon protease-like protein